jgi:peptidoglycan/LPS O-acetylase OafA/YrhL
MSAPAVSLPAAWMQKLRVRSLAEAYESGADNFLLLRLLAAVLVMYGHSYGFAGTHHGDFITRLGWGNGLYTGSIAVYMFFAISGFLVSGSYVKRANLETFLKARALRILPAYICCITLTALVLGAICTELPLTQYWSAAGTWHYIYVNLWLTQPIEWKLPGVFTHNFVKDAVNGSLWTLPAEVRMYAWVAILGLLGILRRRWLANAAFLTLLLVGCFAPTGLPLVQSIEDRLVATFFLAGAFCFVNREHIPVSSALLAALAAIAMATHGTPVFQFAFGAALTYFCLWFAYMPNFHFFNRFGDYSYGVYLWGFPIQQAISAAVGRPVKAWVNCSVSLVVVLVIAAASWHWIEKPALRLKTKIPK